MSDERSLLLQELKKSLSDDSKTAPADPLLEQKIADAKSDRELKEKYASIFVLVLIFQLGVMNIVFILSGYHILSFERWTLDLYMSGTLAQVFGIVLVIIKNLFPSKRT